MKTGIFTASLEACKLKGKFWEIHSPFDFIRPCGEIVCIPAGFVTDFASTDIMTPIGRISIPGFPADDSYDQAAVVHDLLYGAELIPRAKADIIFREALTALDAVQRWKIQPMYCAVRLFGGLTYGEHTPESIKNIRAMCKLPDNEKRPLWPDGKLRFI